MCAPELYCWPGEGCEVFLTLAEIEACSHAGKCDDDVYRVMMAMRTDGRAASIGDGMLEDLRNTGAYSEEELQDEDANTMRIIWMAACDLAEDMRNGLLDK